jgi:hypothetical protein
MILPSKVIHWASGGVAKNEVRTVAANPKRGNTDNA